MAVVAFVDAEILTGPARMSTVANEVMLHLSVDALDPTVFASGGWRANAAGLARSMVSIKGFMDTVPFEAGALATGDAAWNTLLIGGAQQPATIAATSADLAPCYIAPARDLAHMVFGKVGELIPFAAELSGDGKPAKGQMIHPASVVRTAGGTGSTAILGTVPAGKSLLVALHAVSVPATNVLTLTVQQDDNAGFTSPVTTATLGPVSAPTSLLVIVPGPITPDDRYRLVWTLTGTSLASRFGVAVGVTP